MPVMVELPGGVREEFYSQIEKAISKRLQTKYGANSPMVKQELAAEMEKFNWTIRTPGGSKIKTGRLSIFSITQPPAKQVSTSKGLIESTVREPIQAYSVIDADNSDPTFVDKRFDEKSGKYTQPITDDTARNPDDVSYTSQKYKKYIENGPQALKDYYQELLNTMKETYENVPFMGKHDGRLPQQGATTG